LIKKTFIFHDFNAERLLEWPITQTKDHPECHPSVISEDNLIQDREE